MDPQMVMMAVGGMCCLVLVAGLVMFMYTKGMFGAVTVTPTSIWTSSTCAADPDNCPDAKYCEFFPSDCTGSDTTDTTGNTTAPAIMTYTSQGCNDSHRNEWEARQEPALDPVACPNEIAVKSQTCNAWQSVESPRGSGKFIWALIGKKPGCNPLNNSNLANYNFGDLPQPAVPLAQPSQNIPTGKPTFATFTNEGSWKGGAFARRGRKTRKVKTVRSGRKASRAGRGGKVRRTRSKSPSRRIRRR